MSRFNRRNGGGTQEASRGQNGSAKAGKKPVQSFKYKVRGGNVEVAVWDNEVKGDNGDYVLYSVSIQRSYDGRKEGAKDPDWKETSSMRTEDIPVLQYALTQAYAWIMEEKSNGTPI